MKSNIVKTTFEPEPTDIYHIQLTRSAVVSVIALIINLGGYYLLKQLLGVNYLIAALIGYSLGIVANYYLSVRWVFATRKLKSVNAEFSIFVVINLIGLGIYELLIAGMVEGLNISVLLAPIAGNIIVFFWNFLARKKILY